MRWLFVLLSLPFALWLEDAAASREISERELRRAKPGDVLRVLPLPGGAPNNTKAYHIFYRSTGLKNEPIVVTGAIFIPVNDDDRGDHRPVVAWAHPTTGVTRSCSPTLRTDFYNKIPGLERMLQHGFVVVATDYAGLGGRGPHPYLIGHSQARAVLDSVRAAHQLSHPRSMARFVVWGHSQGGHAALFTGELASTYAPDLEIVGVAAAAPATELAELFRADAGSTWGNALTAMALYAWSNIFSLSADEIVYPDARRAYRRVGRDCLESLGDVLKIMRDEKPLERRFLMRDPTQLPHWRKVMDENTPGRQRINAPVFVAQGLRDNIVPHQITRRHVTRRCQAGEHVTYVQMRSTDHLNAAVHSAHTTVEWMRKRFGNRAMPRRCPQ